ncbi:MAG: GDP-mannose mannosyl hydrolase [Oceanobacter sp.]|nr:MAG: GDP-mannose mannosyl hydrolase [Oceanobacter sp.]
MSKQWLDRETFKTIIDTTPLVSIDLLVRNSQGQILVGKRVNRPAQGYWFVPGGRILKNERLSEAFSRLTEAELGVQLDIKNARYLGLYEHFYDDSIFTDDAGVGGTEVSTHYVVNGFEVVLPEAESSEGLSQNGYAGLPCEQHNEYQWLSEEEFKASDEVHVHSRWYVDKTKGFKSR